MSLSPLRLLAAALLPAVALLALSLPGCGLSQPYPAIRSFTLEAKADPPSRKRGRSPVLQVTAVGAAAACETRKLVYKIGPNELSEDFYNELTGQPARMAADATAR
ncbi:MAG: hypothetical protein LBE49_04980, partial [Deltaproteobacteria bacterium]|nr:hypothetical protein [Deltaproteobacteria bacterium]